MSEFIFSGKASEKMWDSINEVETVEDLRSALYDVCCKLQELEDRIPVHRKHKSDECPACEAEKQMEREYQEMERAKLIY